MSGNIFRDIPESLPDEVFEVLCRNEAVKIERIISRGHVSPESGWYDQEQDEWVIVLRGSAEIEFESGSILNLETGDYLDIPARVKHRVSRTSIEPETIWLAVHFPRITSEI